MSDRPRCVNRTSSTPGASLWSAPPPPPGGHNPIHHGGDNTAGYPSLHPYSAVEPLTGPLPARVHLTAAPNPFRAGTVLGFAVGRDEAGRLRIFNLFGHELRRLARPAGEPGWVELRWDGRDAKGKRVPAGIYFLRIEAGRRAGSGRVIALW